MKEWNTIVIFSILNVLFEFASSVFLGGTISWRENQRKLRYTYRVTFGLGNGPCGSACSYTDIGKKTKAGKPFNETSWACVGCSNHFTGSDLNYVVTAIGENPRWEQGENVFEHRIKDTKFTMSMIIPSILSNTSRAVLTTIVDTRVRNDTHSMNSSPIAALPPYTGIPFGCVSNITLPVIDPDNDVIKCRWATSAECGQACTDLPEAYINENSCTIHINASKQTGYKTGHRYRVAVTVEDFPRFPIELASHILLPNQPISSIPLQFFIDVVSSSSGCKPVITFENKNFPDNKVASYSFLDFHNHVNFVFPVYLLSTRNITTFVQSFTQHINTTIIRNHSGSHHTLELYSKWRPVPQQLGENLLCVWGKDNEGVTTRKQCILGLIADSDECFSNPCHGSATCVNLYRRYACACPPGFKGSTCQKKITCDQNPCLNNGTCSVNSTFSCRCKHGFFGDLCQFEEQPCSSFPCKNGGNCISLSGIYRCLCPKNFIGHSCEIYDACNSPCQNNGSCLNRNGMFVCKCASGWTGSDCSQGLRLTVKASYKRALSLSKFLFILVGSVCCALLLMVLFFFASKNKRASLLSKVRDSHLAENEKMKEIDDNGNNIKKKKTNRKISDESSRIRSALKF